MVLLSVRELNGFNTLLEHLPERFINDEVLATKFLSWWNDQKISRQNAVFIMEHSSLLDVTQKMLAKDNASFECVVFLINVWQPLVSVVDAQHLDHIILLLDKCHSQFWDCSAARVAWLAMLLTLYEHCDKDVLQRLDISLSCLQDPCFAAKQVAIHVVFSMLRKMSQQSGIELVESPVIRQTFCLKFVRILSKQELSDKISLWNELAKFDTATFAYLSEKLDLMEELWFYINSYSTSTALGDLKELTKLVRSLQDVKCDMGELLTALKCWPQQLVSEEQYSQSVNVQCALLASGLLNEYETLSAWTMVISSLKTIAGQLNSLLDSWLNSVIYLLASNTQMLERVTGDIVSSLPNFMKVDDLIPDKTVRLLHNCLQLALSHNNIQMSDVSHLLHACLHVLASPSATTVAKLATLKTVSEIVSLGQRSWCDAWQSVTVDNVTRLADQLTNVLITCMCDIDWAVRDSTIELVSTLVCNYAGEKDFYQWLNTCSLVSHLWPCTLPGGEGYVRASALDMIGQLLSADLCRQAVLDVIGTGDIVSGVLGVVQAGGNENMFVRRAGMRLLVTMTTAGQCNVTEAVNCLKWALFDEDSEVCRLGLDLVSVCLKVMSESLQLQGHSESTASSYITVCSECHQLYCPLVHLCWRHLLHSTDDLPPELVTRALCLAGDMQMLDETCRSEQASDTCQCMRECVKLRQTLHSTQQRLADDCNTDGASTKTYIEALLDDIVLSLEAHHAMHSDDEGFIMDCY